jgi:beta-xylosidase
MTVLLPYASLAANPLFDSADPDVLIADKQYWIFPTREGTKPDDEFYSYSSPDLATWTVHGPILKMNDIRWIADDGAKSHSLWAPGIFHRYDKYYLYFSVGPQNPTPSRIGVAVSDSPSGTFVDSGKALVTGGNGFEAIDPMVFSDAKSHKVYLYCGGSAGSKLHVYELNHDLLTISKEIAVETPENFTEGAFMHRRGGLYYLSYSHGRWNDDSYCVCYSTAPTALGPWTYKGKILESDQEHAGPGHHAFVVDPVTGNWYIVYHRWNGAKATGTMPKSRSIAIESIEFDKKGDILPITMTNMGVAPPGHSRH